MIQATWLEIEELRNTIAEVRDLTDKPFGMNVALSYVKGTDIIDFVINQGIKFVTTSSGSPKVCTRAFQEAGIKVFHVVPTLDMALKAIDCGVDGLVVEGGEGGGFKNPSPVSTMVLLPLIRSRTDLPIRYLVNTHVHFDHLFGNGAFREEGPELVAHARLQGALMSRADIYLARYEEMARAAELAGISYEALLQRILNLGLRR